MRKSKDEQLRREGMSYALRYAKENGLGALEEECRRRGAYDVPLRVNKSALDEFVMRTKTEMLDTVLILTSITLHDEFGFGNKRLKQFSDRFNLKAECIGEEYTTWQEQIDVLKEECNFNLVLRLNDQDVEV